MASKHEDDIQESKDNMSWLRNMRNENVVNRAAVRAEQTRLRGRARAFRAAQARRRRQRRAAAARRRRNRAAAVRRRRYVRRFANEWWQLGYERTPPGDWGGGGQFGGGVQGTHLDRIPPLDSVGEINWGNATGEGGRIGGASVFGNRREAWSFARRFPNWRRDEHSPDVQAELRRLENEYIAQVHERLALQQGGALPPVSGVDYRGIPLQDPTGVEAVGYLQPEARNLHAEGEHQRRVYALDEAQGGVGYALRGEGARVFPPDVTPAGNYALGNRYNQLPPYWTNWRAALGPTDLARRHRQAQQQGQSGFTADPVQTPAHVNANQAALRDYAQLPLARQLEIFPQNYGNDENTH